MACVTKSCIRWYLMITNFVLLGAGTTQLVLNVLGYIKFSGDSKVYHELNSAGNVWFNDIVAISASSFKLVTTVSGLVGACMKSRLALKIFALLLALDILFNIALIVLLSIAFNGMEAASVEYLRKNIIHYGDDSCQDAISFTKNINEYAEKNSCCGWSNKESENLYLNSTWFKRASTQNPPPTVIPTLPKACCSDSDEGKILACVTSVNLTEARSAGFIHAKNCLTLMIIKRLTVVYVSLAACCLSVVLDMISVYATYAVIERKRIIYVEDSTEDDDD